MKEQLLFDVPGEVSRAPEFLTIAEAAQRVRCCERTIRRAIDSGALRAGRIHAVDGKRGGYGSAAQAGECESDGFRAPIRRELAPG
jgi:excisionase family DNA binding protein